MSETKWVMIELLGHRSHVGRVSEVECYGATFAQVEALQPSGVFTTHLYGSKAIYSVTELSEEAARKAALPSAYYACDAFTQPSAREGFCARCGLPDERHKPAPALPAGEPLKLHRNASTDPLEEPILGRWWGIVNVEAYHEDPIALFSRCETAHYELRRRQALPEDDEDYLDEHHHVFRADILGAWRNSHDEDPRSPPGDAEDVIALYEAACAPIAGETILVLGDEMP